jgi:hypothetical protein
MDCRVARIFGCGPLCSASDQSFLVNFPQKVIEKGRRHEQSETPHTHQKYVVSNMRSIDGVARFISKHEKSHCFDPLDGTPSKSDGHREPCLTALTDLLHMQAIVDALLGRCLIPRLKAAADKGVLMQRILAILQPPAPAQQTLEFLEPPPPAQRLLSQQLDAEARAEALSIMARLIAQVAKAAKQTEVTDE